jgi:hypothetical protein
MELGTWADWANVAGSIVVGGAVIYLGWKANHIADLPRQLTQEAEEREGRVLIKFIEEHLAATLGKARSLQRFLEKRLPPDAYRQDNNRRAEFFGISQGLDMKYVQPLLSRLHTTGKNADRIVDSVSICMRISSIASKGQHQASTEILDLWHLQLTHEIEALISNLDAVLLDAP